MKKYLFKMSFFLILILLLSGCATVEKLETRPIMQSEQEISPTIAAEEDYSLKKKVTIARFTDETKYGKGNLFKNDEQQTGQQAMDIFSTKLTKTGKFLMFERPDIDWEMYANTDTTDFKLVSDYIIVGSVSELGRINTSEVGIFSRTKKQTAYAKVNVRLINVKTGQIIYAEEGSGEAFSETGTVMGAGSHAGYDSTLNDRALEAAISKLSSNIVENLLNDRWRAYILDNDEGKIIISGGKSQNIKIGDQFFVIKKGKIVKNPQTGLEIELPGEVIGKIEVESFWGNTPFEEISFCTLIEGNLTEYELSNLYIQQEVDK